MNTKQMKGTFQQDSAPGHVRQVIRKIEALFSVS